MKTNSYAAAVVAMALVAICVEPAFAQSAYPAAPIRMVIPFPPGGPSDILARRVAPKLGEGMRQPIVVDNRPGAAGNIAAEIVARSTPDGYTIMLASANHAINASLYPNLPYDALKDFATVTVLSAAPFILAVTPTLNVTTVQDFIALARAKPGALNYGSGGSGTGPQLAMEVLKQRTSANVVHIPYKGAGPALTDLMGGQVQAMMVDMTAGLRAGQAGKIRILAVSSEQRSPAAPQIPTIAESGVPGFNEVGTQSILVPAGTPPAVIARLHQEFVKVLGNAEIKEFLASQGATPVGNTPEQYAEILRSDVEKWRKIVNELGLRPN